MVEGLPAVTGGESVVRVVLCRHGETALNARQQLQGSGVDPSLNALGQRQAACLGERLKNARVDWIVSSKLKRAVETAATIKSHHPHAPLDSLQPLAEIGWGVHEGAHNPNLEYLHNAWKLGDFDIKPLDGESVHEVALRSVNSLFEIVDRAAKNKSSRYATVVVVVHGRLIRIILAALLHKSLFFMSSFTHQNTGINILDFVIQHEPIENALSSINIVKTITPTFVSAIPFSSMGVEEQRAALQDVLSEQTQRLRIEGADILNELNHDIQIKPITFTDTILTASTTALDSINWLFEDQEKISTSQALIVADSIKTSQSGLVTTHELSCLWRTINGKPQWNMSPSKSSDENAQQEVIRDILVVGVLYNDFSHLAMLDKNIT